MPPLPPDTSLDYRSLFHPDRERPNARAAPPRTAIWVTRYSARQLSTQLATAFQPPLLYAQTASRVLSDPPGSLAPSRRAPRFAQCRGSCTALATAPSPWPPP